ncbi:hypothetical protein F2Q69_00021656 [Brassica cretica]|uniref:Uncharacterized protein n=1 Tax=Brassica cretica TaxID=69181 RepID=A0A8S9QGF1_BRACR|nr:hypothetical protein F2Q69_00021656 [Brassica cretica]
MNAHEAEAAAGQAVSKVEAAMTAAEEAAKEADAAEAARAYAEEASKTLKGKKNICKVMVCTLEANVLQVMRERSAEVEFVC